MADQTDFRIDWEARPAVTLIVRRSRPLSSDEIRMIADVVSEIEELRATVQDNEEVALS